MALVLFNTLSRKKEKFNVPKFRSVKLYTCGPTVYRSQHIGNYRTYIFEDILKRTLLLNGYRVHHITNVTDVGHLTSDDDTGKDKIENEARRIHKNAWDIARQFENEFKSDSRALNILPPQKYVRATDHIVEQIALIKKLESKGYVYTTGDGLYFDTSKVKNYGALAGRAAASTREGSRVEIRKKRHAMDFALWKFSPASEKKQMEWSSPWGIGFPGWHIECSAMSMKYLGPTLDIHAGGTDHIQIHHPNEIAQSEAVTGKIFSRFWMHGAFLTIKGSKMAKSSPETNLTLEMLREHAFDPLDFRYLTLGTHYRKPLSFSWEALRGARNSRLKLLASYKNLKKQKGAKDSILKKVVLKELSDDLNAPKALSSLWKYHENISQHAVLSIDHAFGLGFKKESEKIRNRVIPNTITILVQERERYRKGKKWQKADRIRQKIVKEGYTIEDTPSGPFVHKI